MFSFLLRQHIMQHIVFMVTLSFHSLPIGYVWIIAHNRRDVNRFSLYSGKYTKYT